MLLVVEILVLTMRYDSATAGHPMLEGAFDFARWLLQVVIVATGVLFLFHQPWRATLIRELVGARVESWPWGRLGLHLISFGGLWWITAALLGRSEPSRLEALVWGVAWLALASVTFLSWLAIGLPPGRWWAIAATEPGALIAGLLTGVAALTAGKLAVGLWDPLSGATLSLVYGMLTLLHPDPMLDYQHAVVGTSNFQVEIAPACSGFDGMGLVLVLVLSFLWISRRLLRFPQALVLIPLGLVSIWLANAARLAALVLLGSAGWPELALGGFHSVGGWLIFAGVSLGLISVAGRWSFVMSRAALGSRRSAAGPAAAYLVPMLGLLAIAIASDALGSESDWLYPLRVVVVAGLLWRYRSAYVGLRGAPSWSAVGLGVLAFGVWMGIAQGFGDARGEPMPGWHSQSAASREWIAVWLYFRMVGAVITAPLAEELAFRGYLVRRLIHVDFTSVSPGTFTWPSFLASSLLFGLLHGRWVSGTLCGMIFALALYRRGRVGDAVVAHAVANGLLLAATLALDDWSLLG
jgi:exosortase E/protease (VPEID-CTERM system)